jgi:hypothetical protein
VVGFGLYVGAIQWYFTRVGHQHHMLWFAALVAASPSADALSVDAARRRRGRGSLKHLPWVAYGLPLRLGWVLLGSIYLVPGLAKLATGGPRWVFSDNLRNRAWLEWHGRARDPPAWLARAVDTPVPMRAGALVTVVFEVGFVFMIPSRRGRAATIILSWLFHSGVWLILELDFFMSLALLHLGLHRWGGGRPVRVVAGDPAQLRARSAAPVVVVAAIVVANAAMPLTGQHYGWPFTTYPIFRGVAPQTETVLRAERRRDGQPPRGPDVRATFSRRGLSPGISWFLERAVLTALAAGDEQRFDELWNLLRRDDGLRDGDEVVFHADVIDVAPSVAASRRCELESSGAPPELASDGSEAQRPRKRATASPSRASAAWTSPSSGAKGASATRGPSKRQTPTPRPSTIAKPRKIPPVITSSTWAPSTNCRSRHPISSGSKAPSNRGGGGAPVRAIPPAPEASSTVPSARSRRSPAIASRPARTRPRGTDIQVATSRGSDGPCPAR